MFGSLYYQGCEGSGDGTKSPDEPMVEIGKAKKPLEVFDHLGSVSFCDSRNLSLVHVYPFWAYDLSKEGDGGHIEFTFLSFYIDLFLKQMCKDLFNMLAMGE